MQLNPSIIPRRWQAEALQVWTQELRGITRVVTGGGKTVFSYMCLARFFVKFPDGRAIIVVPTIALLDQWLLDICGATNLREVDVACYSGESLPEQPALVNILVLNTARHVAQEISDMGPTILIVDECHRAGSLENSRALLGQHEAALGLSATPERESDEGFESRIVPALGPIIYSYDYAAAKSDGIIVDFELVNIEISLDACDVDQILTHDKTISDSFRGDPNSVNSRKARESASRSVARAAEYAIRIPWAVKLALHHREERVIIFHERVASLARITGLLSEFGQNSVAYHSHLSESHRRDNLRLFRCGIVNMLVTCRALDEGANVPEANVAIIAHSTTSTRQRIQRLGRVLRPAAGKSCALVYTLYSGSDRQARLVAEAAGLEGVAEIVWKRGFVR